MIKLEPVSHVPRFSATAIRTLLIELLRIADKRFTVRVTLTEDRQTLVDVLAVREHVKKLCPQWPSLSRSLERLKVPDHYEPVARPRKENIQALWSIHEADVILGVAPSEGNDYDIALFSLIVV
jgi:hypothetical protein